MNHWLRKPADECPHLYVASHFHSLSNFLDDRHNMVLYQVSSLAQLMPISSTYLDDGRDPQGER